MCSPRNKPPSNLPLISARAILVHDNQTISDKAQVAEIVRKIFSKPNGPIDELPEDCEEVRINSCETL